MNYTTENIEENPAIVNEMTTEDIAAFKQYYLNKRISVRPLIEKRTAELKRLEIYAKRMNYTYEHIEAIWFMIKGMLDHHDPISRIPRFGRLIGNGIHDMPHMWTGFESVESIKSRKEKQGYCPTDEHFYPRQYAGEYIMRRAIRDGDEFTMKTLARLLYKFCRVNKVTKQENNRLTQYQKADTFSYPKRSYRQAEITLEKVGKGKDMYESIFRELMDILY